MCLESRVVFAVLDFYKETLSGVLWKHGKGMERGRRWASPGWHLEQGEWA